VKIMKNIMHQYWFHFLLSLAFGLSTSLAWAQDEAAKPKGPDWALPLILSFFVIYMFILRPQKKSQKKQQAQLNAVEKGDEVVTKGGILGKVTNVAEKLITLEIADRTRVKVDRNFIHHIQKAEAASK